MTIASINAVAPAAPKAVASTSLGADFNMFLKLLTTQMQNQDPLDPLDTSQYTSQLVQYSQVEQSIQQTGLLKDVVARLSISDMTQMAGLIGREIEVKGAESGLSASGNATWAWSLPKSASTVAGEIVDKNGKVVATVALDAASTAGRASWNGMTSNGARAPVGGYSLRVVAADARGAAIAGTVHGIGTVTEVLAGAGGALQIGIGGIGVPASSLVRVSG